MLPPTEASASDWLRGKPAPQSCSEKRLGTWVCFTRESKNGSRESSGCGRERQGVSPGSEGPGGKRSGAGGKSKTWVFLGKDHLKALRYGGERDSKAHWQCKQKRSTGPLIPICLTCLRVMGASLILKIRESIEKTACSSTCQHSSALCRDQVQTATLSPVKQLFKRICSPPFLSPLPPLLSNSVPV